MNEFGTVDGRRIVEQHCGPTLVGTLGVGPDESAPERRSPVDHRFANYRRNVLPVSIVQLDPDLPLPGYAHAGDAGADLFAREDATIAAGGGRLTMATGIAIAIPIGYAGFVLPRSGLAAKHGITVVNAPGLIDAAYRGEVKVVLLNTDPHLDYRIHRGDRIAQLVLQRVEEVMWDVVRSLDGADRGGGFGHSGR